MALTVEQMDREFVDLVIWGFLRGGQKCTQLHW